METEYFESALHDILDQSYSQHLSDFLIGQLSNPVLEPQEDHGQAAPQIATI